MRRSPDAREGVTNILNDNRSRDNLKSQWQRELSLSLVGGTELAHGSCSRKDGRAVAGPPLSFHHHTLSFPRVLRILLLASPAGVRI